MSQPSSLDPIGRRVRPVFGRRGASVAHEVETIAFGRRLSAPSRDVSLQRQRLLGMYAELSMLFADPAYPDLRLPFSLDGARQRIAIGTVASIQMDADTGAFIFADDTPASTSVLITASAERLMDFVISHLARGADPVAPETGLSLLEKCVGNTVSDVERALILATLRHCHGNRTHAARQLGISLRTLRNKLRSYWQGVVTDDATDQPATLPDPQRPDSLPQRASAAARHIARNSTTE